MEMHNKTNINFLDVLLTLLKYRRLLFGIIASITVVSLILSLIWPKTYKTTVQFFPPPTEKASFGGVLSNLVQMPTSTSKLSSEAILVILDSRSLKEAVINTFKLDSVFGSDIMEILIKKLDARTDISEVREGGFGFNPIVSVKFSFSDSDPQLCENVTSFYILRLDSMITEFNYERMTNTFKAIEKRYNENLQELREAEDKLKAFQEKYGIFDVEAQLKAQIEQLANLKAQSIDLEIRINVFKNTYSENNLQVQQLITQKNEIDAKYGRLINTSKNLEEDQLFKPILEMPELMSQYGSLYREVTVQGKVYEYIYPQYEQLRTQLFSEQLGIQVIDYARMPTYKDSPKRLIIVLSGLLFSVFFGLFLVLLKEHFLKLKNSNIEVYQKWIEIKNSVINDIKLFKS